jgi:endonuclease YncB( thermonuclease family)
MEGDMAIKLGSKVKETYTGFCGVKSKAKEKYGRWLVEVWSTDGECLNTELLSRGFAVPMGYP